MSDLFWLRDEQMQMARLRPFLPQDPQQASA